MSSIFWSLPAWLAPDRIQTAWWGLDPVTPPVDEPVTIQDVKEHARIFIGADDSYIASLISAARLRVEKDSNRALLPQTWDFWLQAWPMDRIFIPRAPLISVAYLNFTDITETVTAVDTSVYDVCTTGDPGSIVKRFGQIWPPGPLSPSRPINARFQAGYKYFSGTVTVGSDGKSTTWTTGDNFDTTWTRLSRITLDGISYPIASIADNEHLTLAVAATPGAEVSYTFNMVPEPAKIAIKMLAAHWYASPQPIVVGRGIASVEIQRTYDDLIDSLPRINPMGLNQIRATGSPIWI